MIYLFQIHCKNREMSSIGNEIYHKIEVNSSPSKYPFSNCFLYNRNIKPADLDYSATRPLTFNDSSTTFL
jgi:hypothetical protein